MRSCVLRWEEKTSIPDKRRRPCDRGGCPGEIPHQDNSVLIKIFEKSAIKAQENATENPKKNPKKGKGKRPEKPEKKTPENSLKKPQRKSFDGARQGRRCEVLLWRAGFWGAKAGRLPLQPMEREPLELEPLELEPMEICPDRLSRSVAAGRARTYRALPGEGRKLRRIRGMDAAPGGEVELNMWLG